MRPSNDTEALLRLWERGLGQPAGTRADALLGGADEGAAPARSLGERNARLLELHGRLFGSELELLSHCPACRAPAQFGGDCAALAARLRPGMAALPPCRLETLGYLIVFRMPDGADIARAADEGGASGGENGGETRDEHFARRLVGRCVLACSREGAEVPVRDMPDAVLDALSQHMETLDPGASVSFALDCPACAAHWQAVLDVGDMLWQKIRTAAERVLLDIDLLARTYGWTEREVLRLHPLRRAAYLQMVTA